MIAEDGFDLGYDHIAVPASRLSAPLLTSSRRGSRRGLSVGENGALRRHSLSFASPNKPPTHHDISSPSPKPSLVEATGEVATGYSENNSTYDGDKTINIVHAKESNSASTGVSAEEQMTEETLSVRVEI